ncbi:hypothetical protein M8J75_000949 [Diaphorina citri]|nr:hypothetical protein M8J75_000949 [Diaphorina citri]
MSVRVSSVKELSVLVDKKIVLMVLGAEDADIEINKPSQEITEFSKLVILFSSTITFPSVKSAPVMETKLDIDWIQCPCGKAPMVTFEGESSESSENSSGSSSKQATSISSSEARDSINKIVNSGNIAIKSAEIFKNEYADLMQTSYEVQMKDFLGPVVWLKDAMDSLNKLKESSSEVEKIRFAYEIMQQYAHGIEYIIQDQIAMGNKDFLDKFLNVRMSLKAVLCETHWVMTNELGIQPQETKSPITHIPISRNGSERAMDDWIIYHNYITVMNEIVKELQKLCASNEKMI